MPPLAVSPPRITSPSSHPTNKLRSPLSANTLIVHYETVDDLITRVEGAMFHTVIVHVQGVVAKAAEPLAVALSKARPGWHICMYNPPAELLMLEIPSHAHEKLHTDLHMRFLNKLRSRDIAAQFDVDEISGTLCTSLSRDHSLAQPDSAVRPKCRLDDYSAKRDVTAAEMDDEIEVEVEVPEEPPAAAEPVAIPAQLSPPTSEHTSAIVHLNDAQSAARQATASTQKASNTTDTPATTDAAPAAGESSTAAPESATTETPAPPKKLKKKKKKKLTEDEKAKRKEDRRLHEENKRKFPSFVIEAGWAQSVLMLQNKARWWLAASDGQVRTVLIAKAVQATGTVVIEKWTAATRRCSQHIEIKPIDDWCPLKRKKLLPIQLDDVVEDDEHMLDGGEEEVVPLAPEQFHVIGGPIYISFNDVFLAEPGAMPKPEYDICITEQDLKEYACHVWNTAAAEDAGRTLPVA